MRPEHLDLLTAASSPSLTPDGSTVVVAVGGPHLDSDSVRSSLWAIRTDGSGARRLTNGNRDTAPAVSPDGQRVAFLRAGEGAKPQIHVMRIDGGEPICLTDQPLGAGAPVWSPDGTRLAWSARVTEPGRYGTEDTDGKTVTPDAEPPRLITEFRYRLDNLGYTRDRRAHVFVGPVPLHDEPGGSVPEVVEAQQLTAGDADDTQPIWSPDGAMIAFISARHATCEVDMRSGVYCVPADAVDPVELPDQMVGGDLSIDAFAWLPDGRMALTSRHLGSTGLDFIRPSSLWCTTGAVTPGELADTQIVTDDHVMAADGAPVAAGEGGAVLLKSARRGTVELLTVGADGAVNPLLAGVEVTGAAVSVDGATVVVTASTAERTGDVAIVRSNDPTWLTDLSAPLRSETHVVLPTDIMAPTSDGHEVHGWLLLPDTERFGDGPYPLLLNIHGGPMAQYTSSFFDEAQVYVGAGYAVAMCNPRGSLGYGVEHARSIAGAMGSVDADDIITFLDHVLSEAADALDPARVGVMGGSYGGYMTATLTTRTDRFVAAIVERGYLDGASFHGSSDIGWFFPEQYHGSLAAAVEQSPMSAVDRVTTPTLVIHSEADWRTPIEQGQRWFTSLKTNGVDTELLIFPAESHELSRSGRPRHRRDRFEHILRWWERHLPIAE